MTSQFHVTIPATSGNVLNFQINAGDVVYLLGANGTGKSSLVSHLFTQHHAGAKRISAHRQTWFQSNTLDMTPKSREDMDKNVRAHDTQVHARYTEWNSGGRANMAIFDLIDADTMQARIIADLLRSGNDAAAKKEAQAPSPLQNINELMRLSNLPIEIRLEEGQKIVARKNGGVGYSVAELSDGERNAFLIGADVLTAKPGTLILIDEPERHLHRSIISPLLKLLFDRRKDCAFVVSTHELMLPTDTPKSTTLLVRGCEYQGQQVQGWTVDIVPPDIPIDDELKQDVLGTRRKILFVEGTTTSLDLPLYSLLFPQVSVVPKERCSNVEHAVRGLRGASDMHWLAAWGIVDNDQRLLEDIERLRTAGIWALSHYSVESYYYHPKVVARIAARQAKVVGGDEAAMLRNALELGVEAANAHRDHLVRSTVLRKVRSEVLRQLPVRSDIENSNEIKLEIDVAFLRATETKRFESLVAESDWEGLLIRYPLRESPAFDRVVKEIKIADGTTYRAAVLKLLQDEPDAVAELRILLGGLYESVMA